MQKFLAHFKEKCSIASIWMSVCPYLKFSKVRLSYLYLKRLDVRPSVFGLTEVRSSFLSFPRYNSFSYCVLFLNIKKQHYIISVIIFSCFCLLLLFTSLYSSFLSKVPTLTFHKISFKMKAKHE